jgi:hypothetical protein
LRLTLALLPGVVYLYLLFLNQQNLDLKPDYHLQLFVGCVFLYMVLFSLVTPSSNWKHNLLLSLLVVAAFRRSEQFISGISITPWSLSWSEGSRYYYASLFFSQKLYGIDTPPSVLHVSRYLMQAVIFLIPNGPIWLHRLWQVILWLTTSIGAGWLLANRLRPRTIPHIEFPTAVYITRSFLFLMQGPVYYHLMVIVILIIWGVQTERFRYSLVIVIIASIWAGLSRLNWFLVPGLLATSFYLLEQPIKLTVNNTTDKPVNKLNIIVKYLNAPVIWTLMGVITAYITQVLYTVVSGNPIENFNSALTTPLLWYRLFPNPTNPIGILPAILFVSIPMWIIIYYQTKWRQINLHLLRWLMLAIILLMFFIGGLIVSVKIGGGADLHNLDAYLVFLWIIGSYCYFGAINNDRVFNHPIRVVRWLVVPSLMVPVIWSFLLNTSYEHQNLAIAQDELHLLKQTLSDAKGEILFINERQLLTFDEVSNLSLVPEYEAVFLMEMAMANNQEYLNKFHTSLSTHAYTYIVSYKLCMFLKGKIFPFGEENDVWVIQVSRPILCHYEPVLILDEVNLLLLAPRRQNCMTP